MSNIRTSSWSVSLSRFVAWFVVYIAFVQALFVVTSGGWFIVYEIISAIVLGVVLVFVLLSLMLKEYKKTTTVSIPRWLLYVAPVIQIILLLLNPYECADVSSGYSIFATRLMSGDLMRPICDGSLVIPYNAANVLQWSHWFFLAVLCYGLVRGIVTATKKK